MDKKKYNILVVEDNLGDFVLIEDYINEQIIAPNIVLAKNFKEAKQLTQNGKFKFDIILLDLSLPDSSGEQLIIEITSLKLDCPIIALTGYTDIEFSIKSMSLGIADYLLKEDINATSLYKSIVYNIERTKTNFKLFESEKRYSDLFQLSPQPMWVFDLESLRFLDVNQVAVDHYGYSKEEFLSKTIRDIRPTEDIYIVDEAVKKIKDEPEGGITMGTYRHTKKNGECIQVELRGNIINYNGRKAEIIVVNDITEKANYIKAIEEQNKILNEIAWMQSHLVRAPLARMMGLIDVIQNHSLNDVEKEEMMTYLLNSANELDILIKDISNKTYEAKLKN